MDLEELRRRLAEQPAARLTAELVHLAGWDRALHRRLELVALEGDSGKHAAALRRRVAGLKRSKTFVERKASSAFARELEGILDSIREGLLDADPESARSILESFIQADGATLERVHDSSGSVGFVFGEACRLYLQAAARARGKRDWVSRLQELVSADPYGVREDLLEHAAELLSEHELRRLARRFEENWRRAQAASEGEGHKGVFALSRLALVAKALRDPRLYERSVTLPGGPLSDQQRLDVARRYLEYGQPHEALNHLRSVSTGDFERLRLLADCYEQTGQEAERIDCLWGLAERLLSWKYFEELLAILPEEDHEAARERARGMALEAEDDVGAAVMLLRLCFDADAERLVIDRREALSQHFYARLSNLAELAGERRAHRIEVFCYRALLEDILDEGRSRAYGHAARYLRRLGELDGLVDSYAPAVAHDEYVASLRARHGRKYAFWGRVEGGSSSRRG